MREHVSLLGRGTRGRTSLPSRWWFYPLGPSAQQKVKIPALRATQTFVLNAKTKNISTEHDKPFGEGKQQPLRRLNEFLLRLNLKTLPTILNTDKGSSGKLNHRSDYHLSSTSRLFSTAVHSNLQLRDFMASGIISL